MALWFFFFDLEAAFAARVTQLDFQESHSKSSQRKNYNRHDISALVCALSNVRSIITAYFFTQNRKFYNVIAQNNANKLKRNTQTRATFVS